MEPKDEIKARLDVADVVGDYLALKPAGSGSFKALCPFHGENTPSFYVSKEKQIWHCFGCNKGGDVLSFVMEMEGMNFPEALRFLGKKAGVEVPEFRPERHSADDDALIALNELAGKFFEAVLWRHEEGKVARDYLASREIGEELAQSFRLGAAPDRWDALRDALAKKGFSEKQMLAAGLVKERNAGGGVIDRFRGRLMIPLADVRGRIVGFTARLLVPQGEKTGPKYLNSPETKVYRKGELLYGFDVARSEARKNDAVIIVEGNLDVVASHKAGVKHVVASSGTALSEAQLRQIKRVTNNVFFAFDADAAGFNAARRGMRLAQELGMRVHVISIPEEIGKDPDDVVRKNPEAWRTLAKTPAHIMEYFFKRSLVNFDIANIDSKREVAHFLVEEIGRLSDPIERDHWLQQLSDTMRIESTTLKELLDRQKRPVPRTEPEKQTVAPQPADQKITSRIDQAASFLVGLALQSDEEREELAGRLSDDDLPEGRWRDIYKKLILHYTHWQSSGSTQKTFFSEFRDTLQSESNATEIGLIDAAVLRVENTISGLNRAQVREELNRHLAILRESSRETRRKDLEAAIRQAESSGDSSRVKALMEEYSKLL